MNRFRAWVRACWSAWGLAAFFVVLTYGVLVPAWPEIVTRWRVLSTITPPISIPNAEARWVNDKQFDITAPAYHWTDTCPTVYVTWWVQTRRHGLVLVAGSEAVEGPFKDRGRLPASYEIGIEPTVGPPLHLRVTIPDWLAASDVQLVAVDDVVPDDAPCASGWTGVVRVLSLQVMQ